MSPDLQPPTKRMRILSPASAATSQNLAIAKVTQPAPPLSPDSPPRNFMTPTPSSFKKRPKSTIKKSGIKPISEQNIRRFSSGTSAALYELGLKQYPSSTTSSSLITINDASNTPLPNHPISFFVPSVPPTPPRQSNNEKSIVFKQSPLRH